MNRKALERRVALANQSSYYLSASDAYIDGAPHLKHREIQDLYARLVVQVYDRARLSADEPSVLDLGAGEGSATLPFLALGARVTAVDISETQLSRLRAKCESHAKRLEVRCGDVYEILRSPGEPCDVVVVNSFLHHLPDYIGLIEQCVRLLKPGGQFFCFQDPLRYDTIGLFTRAFSRIGYLSWRVLKGDVVGGTKRLLRRSVVGLSDDNPEDMVEYHVMRNGLDQEAVVNTLEEAGLACEVIKYYSTQSRLFQRLGDGMGLANTFAVIAAREDRNRWTY